MTRRQSLAAAAASFGLALGAGAAAVAGAATGGERNVGEPGAMHRMASGGMARMHDERSYEEMHTLCHRMMAGQLGEEERGRQAP